MEFNDVSRHVGAYVVLLAFLGLGVPLRAQTVLFTEGFETSGEGTRYTSNTYNEPSPNCNFFARMPASPLDVCFGPANVFTNFQGSFFWGSEDIMRSGTPLPAGDITTQSINITGYNTLRVSLFLATSNNITPTNTRWESADSVNIKASINGGAYVVVGRFMGTAAGGGDLIKDVNLNGVFDVGEPVASLAAFTQHTFNISGTGTSLRIKLDFDQVGGSEELGVDQIVVSGTITVPVRWASFGVSQQGSSALVAWETTEEVNAKEYVVERLVGDGSYMDIGTVAAQGYGSSYTFVDPSPAVGDNLYRIRQVDLDNTTSYSETASLHFTRAFEMRLYPNPAAESSTLDFGGQVLSGNVLLMDQMGKVVRQVAVDAQSQVELATADLPAGVYLLRAAMDGEKARTQRLVVAH